MHVDRICQRDSIMRHARITWHACMMPDAHTYNTGHTNDEQTAPCKARQSMWCNPMATRRSCMARPAWHATRSMQPPTRPSRTRVASQAIWTAWRMGRVHGTIEGWMRGNGRAMYTRRVWRQAIYRESNEYKGDEQM